MIFLNKKKKKKKILLMKLITKANTQPQYDYSQYQQQYAQYAAAMYGQRK